MTNDVHYVAEKYIQELIETGLWMDPTARVIRKPKARPAIEGFVLLRGKSYFYGHHPRTDEAMWTYEIGLAQVVTECDANELMSFLSTLDRPVVKHPAPAFREALR